MVLVFRSFSLPASLWNQIVYLNVPSVSWLEATAEPIRGPLASSSLILGQWEHKNNLSRNMRAQTCDPSYANLS
jgi:hypothetical protein